VTRPASGGPRKKKKSPGSDPMGKKSKGDTQLRKIGKMHRRHSVPVGMKEGRDEQQPPDPDDDITRQEREAMKKENSQNKKVGRRCYHSKKETKK